MGVVNVENTNIYPFSGKFRDEKIFIPAGGKIQMDHEDAITFLGEMNHMKFDGAGNQLPESYKMLWIRDYVAEEVKPNNFISHATGRIFSSKEEMEEFEAENCLDNLEDQSLVEKIKNKPGRPKKAQA